MWLWSGNFSFIINKEKCISTNVVNTVPIPIVPAGMYHIDTYTGIKIPIFRTGLNTGRIGHTGQFQAILASNERTGWYQKKKAFFFF